MNNILKRLYEERGEILHEMEETCRDPKKWESGGAVKFASYEKQLRDLEERIGEAEKGWVNERLQMVSATYANPDQRIFSGVETMKDRPSPIKLGAFLRALAIGPRNEIQDDYISRALSAGAASGSYTVPDILLKEFMDKLRAQSVLFKLGARTVMVESDTNYLSVIATDPDITWVSEAEGMSDSTPTLNQVTISPETAYGLVKASLQLVQDSINIEEILETMFVNSFQKEIERVALVGTGSSNEPEGLYTETGLAVTYSAVGSELGDYTDLLSLQERIEREGGVNTGFVTSPRTMRDLRALTDTTSQHIQPPPGLAPIYTTSAIPIDQTVGGNSDCSCVLAGDWSKLWVAIRMKPTITVLKERYLADNLQYAFLCAMRMDVGITIPTAFGKIVAVGAADGGAT